MDEAMIEEQMPSTEHEQFDAMCAALDDYEPLPDATGPGPAGPTGPAMEAAADSAGSHEATIDAEILAGLVSP
jgi:hypothetical protein